MLDLKLYDTENVYLNLYDTENVYLNLYDTENIGSGFIQKMFDLYSYNTENV